MKGMTVYLHERKKTGTDDFNSPIYSEELTPVENVLVSPVSAQDAQSQYAMNGTTIVYNLAIPKGDNHEWRGAVVSFFGDDWDVVGEPIEGINDLIPLQWNKKLTVKKHG